MRSPGTVLIWWGALTILLAAGCGGRDEPAAAFPEPGETVAFARIRVAGMRASTLAIREVDESGPAGKAATIRAQQGARTYPVFLPPGQYAVAGVQDPSGESLMGGTLVFEIAPGKATYFGTFDMLIESGRFCAVDLSDAAFREAAAEFRKQYPALNARFEIVNAISRTDRIEARIPPDGGVAQ
jgi:hypothetical protein